MDQRWSQKGILKRCKFCAHAGVWLETVDHADMNDPGTGSGVEASKAIHFERSEVGASGAGYRWSMKDGSQDEDWRYSIAPIPADRIKEMIIREEQGDLEDTVQDAGAIAGPDNAQNSEDEDDDDDDGKLDFDKEVEETFKRAVLEGSGVQEDHVIIEVNGLRLACNASFSDCAGALFKAILNLAIEQKHSTANELYANAKAVLIKWKNLLKNYLKNEDDEVEVLLKFEEVCLESAKEFSPIFCAILQVLYDQDMVSEYAIVSWASEKQGADETDKIFVKQCEKFIKWLQEASEEDDSDS